MPVLLPQKLAHCRARAAFAIVGALIGLLLAPGTMAQQVLHGPRAQEPPVLTALHARPAEAEVIYFLLPDRFDNAEPANDRGGLTGGPLQTGFDPTNKGFYHGGDLAGILRRLDYIQHLGATAIWVGPIFKNKPVQGAPGQESAGYHGYWITDFTSVDPHLGSDADFKALVAAAHARGIKVYMDIVINHTADVIHYRECPNGGCPYRGRADYPYQRRGGVAGAAINPGFAGDSDESEANFAHLTDPTYAYTPYVEPAEAHEKKPDWLNDPLFYHNRGDTTYQGESATMGDFSGLDDLMTENPRVIAGMIAIYGDWIDRYGIDGFRVDTARHVNPEFWRAFIPAMQARARADGLPHFPIFGEVAGDGPNEARQATWTHTANFPATLDFAFHNAVQDVVAGKAGTERLADLFAADPLYAGDANGEVTWVSNHDNGRLAYFIRQAFPGASEGEVQARVILAHAMLFTLRGVPAIYAGDEQGFAGTGGDQAAREDLFPTQVASYQAERLVGGAPFGKAAHFAEDGPIFKAIAALAHLRRAEAALQSGRQVARASSPSPGLFAVSRFDLRDGHELVLAFNTSAQPLHVHLETDVKSLSFTSLIGACPARAAAPGSITLDLPAFGYAVCAAQP